MRRASKTVIIPSKRTTLEKDGFISNLYLPLKNKYEGKAIIVVSGGEGSFLIAQKTAERFAKSGIAALALAYWNMEGLSDTVSLIPLEYAEKAAIWLKNEGFDKVGMWGISKGAEYSLLCASYLNELISFVIAVSPVNACMQGFQMINKQHKLFKDLPYSTFTFREKEIPYAPAHIKLTGILLDCLMAKGVSIKSAYNPNVENVPEESIIPVERIKGPVLLLAAHYDDVWYSKSSSEAIMKRLKKYDFGYPAHAYFYKYASHMIVPRKLKCKYLFDIERKMPHRCNMSNIDAYKKTLCFLKNV